MAAYHSNPPVYQGTATMVAQPMQAAPIVVPLQPQMTMNIKVIRGLGITQIVFGALVICLGIGTIVGFNQDYWLTNSGGGIWGGLWILVTGVIGVCSASYPKNGILNGTHMGFSIVATVVAFIDGIFFASGIAYYNNCEYGYNYYNTYGGFHYNYNRYKERYDCFKQKDAGRAVYAILVILMVAEFFVALVASIYCCQATSCCCRGTMGGRGGVIVQQAQPQYIVTSSSGQTFMQPVSYQQNPGMVTQYPMAPPQYPQPMVQQTHITGPAAVGNNTNVAYSEEHKSPAPPQYAS